MYVSSLLEQNNFWTIYNKPKASHPGLPQDQRKKSMRRDGKHFLLQVFNNRNILSKFSCDQQFTHSKLSLGEALLNSTEFS